MKSVNVSINGKNYETKLSTRKGKKLMSMFDDKWVHYGADGYEHFKDRSGLLPSNLNHLDPKRRTNYLKRHANTRYKKGTPSWFSWHVLW